MGRLAIDGARTRHDVGLRSCAARVYTCRAPGTKHATATLIIVEARRASRQDLSDLHRRCAHHRQRPSAELRQGRACGARADVE